MRHNTEDVQVKDIPGFNGRYRIRSDGVVEDCGKRKKDLLSGDMIFYNSDQWRAIKPTWPHGYAQARLNLDSKECSRRVHREVAKAFIPNPEDKPCVRHKDRNKYNNHMDNLEWCSKMEILENFENKKKDTEIPLNNLLNKANESLYQNHVNRIAKDFDYRMSSEKEKKIWKDRIRKLYFGTINNKNY